MEARMVVPQTHLADLDVTKFPTPAIEFYSAVLDRRKHVLTLEGADAEGLKRVERYKVKCCSRCEHPLEADKTADVNPYIAEWSDAVFVKISLENDLKYTNSLNEFFSENDLSITKYSNKVKVKDIVGNYYEYSANDEDSQLAIKIEYWGAVLVTDVLDKSYPQRLKCLGYNKDHVPVFISLTMDELLKKVGSTSSSIKETLLKGTTFSEDTELAILYDVNKLIKDRDTKELP